MEGVASEAASLGGHLQLGNLIVVCFLDIVVSETVYLFVTRSTMITVSFEENMVCTIINSLPLDISIDGDTAVAFTENVEQRFLAYGWHVLHVDNGDR